MVLVDLAELVLVQGLLQGLRGRQVRGLPSHPVRVRDRVRIRVMVMVRDRGFSG